MTDDWSTDLDRDDVDAVEELVALLRDHGARVQSVDVDGEYNGLEFSIDGHLKPGAIEQLAGE